MFYIDLHWLKEAVLLVQQESPPAWTQEAYRPPCSEYSFCCPTWVPPPPAGYPPPILTWLGGGTWPGYPPPPGQGTPPSWPGRGGYLTRVPPRPGYPPHPDLAGGGTWPGTPPARVPPPPRLDLAGYPPPPLPHGILGNVAKHYGIWVPPPVDKLTKWNYYLPVVLRTRAVITTNWRKIDKNRKMFPRSM